MIIFGKRPPASDPKPSPSAGAQRAALAIMISSRMKETQILPAPAPFAPPRWKFLLPSQHPLPCGWVTIQTMYGFCKPVCMRLGIITAFSPAITAKMYRLPLLRFSRMQASQPTVAAALIRWQSFSPQNKLITQKNAVLKRTASLFLCFISPRCWNSWELPW